ncbi:threonine/serine exporter family protein [Marinilactibacillus piezotolerans]|uniref:threonine/serine exporter family protein n=1 Tax=Marinilactibacillus piezotolerans TaxID=258723 RepID=UPI002118B4F5|nr:threonine/serine exporter family protein [Marinilactibacillus piezotolerans]
MENYPVADILDVCVEAGRVMLENGAETYRVEDTLYRIAKSYGLTYINVFVVPTALIITVQGKDKQDHTELLRMTDRQTNLEKVSKVNDLSRQLTETILSPDEVKELLQAIKETPRNFNQRQRNLAIACACGCFPLLFGGTYNDMLPSFIAGGLGHLLFDIVNRWTNVSFFAEMVASFFIGLCAVFFISLGIGNNVNTVIIGSVMCLVPGMAITNSFRDLMAGHLLAGVAVVAKALLTAGAIGIGIALVLTFL